MVQCVYSRIHAIGVRTLILSRGAHIDVWIQLTIIITMIWTIDPGPRREKNEWKNIRIFHLTEKRRQECRRRFFSLSLCYSLSFCFCFCTWTRNSVYVFLFFVLRSVDHCFMPVQKRYTVPSIACAYALIYSLAHYYYYYFRSLSTFSSSVAHFFFRFLFLFSGEFFWFCFACFAVEAQLFSTLLL